MTGTRNVLRSLGGVAGVAVSTAAYHSVMASALGKTVPEPLRKSVLDGTWHPGDEGSDQWESDILGARMEGFRVVFIMQIPLMVVCLIGCLFIADVVLRGDPKKDQPREQPQEEESRAQEPELDQDSHGPSQPEGLKAVEIQAESLRASETVVRKPAQLAGEQSESARL